MRGIDHLVYTVSDLLSGMDEIESLLGVRPALGGRHPNFGTQNALLSLGPTTYLEIIAPDPELIVPKKGLPFGMGNMSKSRLATWAYRSELIEEQTAVAMEAGIDLGAIEEGSRRKTDGSLLSWKLTDPNAMLLDGAVPFLISWGDTPHPAGHVPRVGKLVVLRIEHPYPNRVRATLNVLGANIDVAKAGTMRIIAMIMTGRGRVELS